MRWILHSLIALLLLAAPAAAQSTRAQLNTEITTNFPDNTTGLITPSILRTTTSDFVTSFGVLNDPNTFTKANTFNPASGDAISINPAATTYAKGFNIVQSGPTSTIAGPIAYNKIVATHAGPVTGAAGPFSLLGGRALAFSSTMVLGGSSWTSGALGGGEFIAAATVAGIPAGAGDIIGVTGVGYINVTHASTTAGVFGMNPYVFVDTTGNVAQAVGQENDVGIATGGVAGIRIGSRMRAISNITATGLDSAFVIDNFGSAGAAWKAALTISKVGSGIIPLAITANIFTADAAITVNDVLSFPTMTVSGNIANFSTLGISGAGKAIFGGPIGSLTAGVNLQVTAPSSGNINLGVSTNTTSGFNTVTVLNSTSAVEVDVLANEPNRTAVHFGQTNGNWAEIAFTSPNGALLGTAGNVPFILGTNNAARIRITGAGLVNIGTDVTPPVNALLTVNKNATTPAAAVTGADLFHIAGADTTQPVALIDSYHGASAGNQAFVVIRGARGTGASPTALLSGDSIGFFGMVGATGAGTFASETSAGGTTGGVFFGAVTTENWSATNQGTEMRLYATPTGSLAIVQGMGISSGVIVGAPTGTYKGTGTLNVATAIYANGTVGATCPAGISATTGRSVGGIITAC